MYESIGELFQKNLMYILKNSYTDCHVKGLHSVAIEKDEEGRLVRLFYTDKNHELYKNSITKKVNDKNKGYYFKRNLSLGIHPHRNHLFLLVVKGLMINLSFEKCSHGDSNISLDKYEYKSPLISGESEDNFNFVGRWYLKYIDSVPYTYGQSFHLDSKDLHTVSCPKNEINAWFIFEGHKDESYENVMYSNRKPKLDENFYKPITREKLSEIAKNLFNIDLDYTEVDEAIEYNKTNNIGQRKLSPYMPIYSTNPTLKFETPERILTGIWFNKNA